MVGFSEGWVHWLVLVFCGFLFGLGWVLFHWFWFGVGGGLVGVFLFGFFLGGFFFFSRIGSSLFTLLKPCKLSWR